MDFKEKIKRKTEEKDADQDSEIIGQVEPSQFFGIDNIRSFPPCVDLRLPDGNSKALPYSFIVEINFEASSEIEILTTSKKILITGRNLQKLYNYLIAFRVKYIQSNVGNDLSEEQSLFVKTINIEEL